MPGSARRAVSWWLVGVLGGVGCGLGGGVVAEAGSDGLVVAALFGVDEVGQHLLVGGGGLAAQRQCPGVERAGQTGFSSAAYMVSWASSSKNATMPMTVPNAP